MQIKKIYLDFNLKNNSELISAIADNNILSESLDFKNNLYDFNQNEINDDELLIIYYKTFSDINKNRISDFISKTQNISKIILFNSDENIDFNIFENMALINFYETENFIANFSNYINFILHNNLHQTKLNNEYNEKINNLICYKNLFDSINAGVITLNNDFEIIKINSFTSKLFNIENITHLNDIIQPEDYDEFINYLKDFSNSSENHTTLQLQGGKNRKKVLSLEINITKIYQFDSVYFMLVISDIGDIIQKEEEIADLIEEMQLNKEIIEQNASDQIMLNSKLFEQQEELKLLNASKDKFFSIIAHDLKTPFQSLLGYSDILSKDIADLDKSEIKLFAENLNESAHKLFKLLENLLHWSRIQRGVITYNPEEIDLYLLSELNADLINSRAKEKGLKVNNKIKPGTTCYGDTNIINTILRNLLSNAIKFTPKGGLVVLESEIKDTDTYLHVSDNGVGMSKEDMEKIFRIDSHHTTPGTNQEEGTGLGLILCYELAHKNNGELFVDSEVGKGTTFTLQIPSKKNS